MKTIISTLCVVCFFTTYLSGNPIIKDNAPSEYKTGQMNAKPMSISGIVLSKNEISYKSFRLCVKAKQAELHTKRLHVSANFLNSVNIAYHLKPTNDDLWRLQKFHIAYKKNTADRRLIFVPLELAESIELQIFIN